MSTGSHQVDWRGGDPARSYAGATGGATQTSIFASPTLASYLSEVCGLRLKLAGVGSFSYYEPGDFLALHRDIVTCDITLLTCLRDTATGTPDRQGLRIYPAYARVPLTQLRSDDAPAHIDVSLDRGQTAVLLGGIVPHEVLSDGRASAPHRLGRLHDRAGVSHYHVPNSGPRTPVGVVRHAGERAMYFGSSPLWKAGHESAGVTAPSTTWFLAEGATGSYFETFVLLANPNPRPVTATLTFLPATGQPVVKTKSIPANGRVTVNIEGEDPSLASAAVATSVSSPEPIIVERSQ